MNARNDNYTGLSAHPINDPVQIDSSERRRAFSRRIARRHTGFGKIAWCTIRSPVGAAGGQGIAERERHFIGHRQHDRVVPGIEREFLRQIVPWRFARRTRVKAAGGLNNCTATTNATSVTLIRRSTINASPAASVSTKAGAMSIKARAR